MCVFFNLTKKVQAQDSDSAKYNKKVPHVGNFYIHVSRNDDSLVVKCADMRLEGQTKTTLMCMLLQH